MVFKDFSIFNSGGHFVQWCWTVKISLIQCCDFLYNTLAAIETESQFPPVNVNLPSPIRPKISLGVSFGPLANGVCLQNISVILTNCISCIMGDIEDLTCAHALLNLLNKLVWFDSLCPCQQLWSCRDG